MSAAFVGAQVVVVDALVALRLQAELVVLQGVLGLAWRRGRQFVVEQLVSRYLNVQRWISVVAVFFWIVIFTVKVLI